MQLTPASSLEHLRSVHRPSARARADNRVQLVDEEDDLPLCVRDLLEHGLQSFSNSPRYLAPATAHQSRAKIFLFLSPAGTSGGRALGEAFNDGRLADAGFADEDGLFLVRRDAPGSHA